MSHLSRKTSGIWDTQDRLTNKRIKPMGGTRSENGSCISNRLSLAPCLRSYLECQNGLARDG
jgi:hypothetical protein